MLSRPLGRDAARVHRAPRGQALSGDQVIAYCREGLADFKRPRKVTFLAELPRNPTGKVLKRDSAR